MQHSCFSGPVKVQKIINASSIKDCYEPEVHEEDTEENTEKETEEVIGEVETTQPINSLFEPIKVVAIKKKRKTAPEI